MSFPFGFDLKLLEVFVEVVKTGNMSLAAQRLSVTQSSISQSISNLESELNVQLLNRSVRPIQVTANGRYFFDRSVRLLEEARQTSQNLRAGHIQQIDQVRIALVDSMVSAFGQPLLDTIKKHTRDWSITTGLSHVHAQRLLSHDVDIIISDDAVNHSDELSRYPILREPLLLVVPSSYSFQPGEFVSLQDNLEMARYPEHSLIGQTIERQLTRLQLNPGKKLRLDNTFAIISMVAAERCWTITSPLCLYQCLKWARGRVQVLPLPAYVDYRELTLVCRRYDLWNLPEEIAAKSRTVLQQEIIPELINWVPWLDSCLTTIELSHPTIRRANSMAL
ncbi:LysR family transcriptional regulator [Endozoicomonas arenosclerae]|uniref:LysR family transcriptional regulator n=1 Tax=Endozoicomonas arenosclerae TaxID=1633495 RepID=UPI0009A1F7B4|nr:LysR family transcriptional regulator [Endozoicomonas arenosclerae]